MNNFSNITPGVALPATDRALGFDAFLTALLACLAAFIGAASPARAHRVGMLRAALLHLLHSHAAGTRAWPRTPSPLSHAHRRDLGLLRTACPIPVRPRRVHPSRAARRRIALCWRLLLQPPRRHPRYTLQRRPAAPARPLCRPAPRYLHPFAQSPPGA